MHKTLTNDEEISAFVHHTRMQMLAALRGAPATGTQIAERLGVHPANLTRHWRVLVEAGLVKVVEKRDTGRNLEKYYAATAESFDVAPEADTLTAPHKIALAFARSEFSAALARLPDKTPGPVAVRVVEARLTPAKVTDFLTELEDLARRFESHDGAGEPYTLTAAFYPGETSAGPARRIFLKRTRRADR